MHDPSIPFCYIIAGLLALTVGAVELLTRYRDEPFTTIVGSWSSFWYILLNGVIGLVSFAILLATTPELDGLGGQSSTELERKLRALDEDSKVKILEAIDFIQNTRGGETKIENIDSLQDTEELEPAELTAFSQFENLFDRDVSLADARTMLVESGSSRSNGLLLYALAAGLGGSVIMRSRLITIRSGGQDVSIGPSVMIDQFLTILDRQIDRKRALLRMKTVRETMLGVNYAKAQPHMFNMIVNGLQNMSAEEREELVAQGDAIQGNMGDAQERCYALGFLALDFMGERFLQEIFDETHRPKLTGDEYPIDLSDATYSETDADTNSFIREELQGVSFNKLKQRLADLNTYQDSEIPEEMRKLLGKKIQAISKSEQSNVEKGQTLAFAIKDCAGSEYLIKHFSGISP